MSEWEVVSEEPIQSQDSNEWEVVEEKPIAETGWGSRVVGDLKKRFENITAPENFTPSIPERALRTTGQIAGAANDVIGQTLKSAYKTLVPDKAQKVISDTASDVFSSPYIQEPVKAAMEGYGKFKEAMPDVAQDVEAAANIGAFLPMGKGAYAAGSAVNAARKEGVNIFKDIVVPQSREAIDNEINNTIRYSVEKAIRPPVSKGSDFGKAKQYFDRASSAVKDIVANKENLTLTDVDGNVMKGSLPQSLKQFSEAIDQTKRSIFTKYDDMAKAAGESGAVVDLSPTVREIEKFSSSPVLQDLSPDVFKYTQQRVESLSARGAYTTTEAQDAITHLNKSLEAFYKNPSYETASRAGVDALIANNLRRSLDSTIEKTTGEGYQALKNAYGSLKTIEDDVAKRSMVDARKNVHGLLDFTDIFTSGELLAGIATMNPAMVMRAGAWKSVKEYFKHINNPNRVVKAMFQAIDKVLKTDPTGFKSQTLRNSSTFRGLDDVLGANQTGNASVKPVSGSAPSRTPLPPSTDVKSGRVKGRPTGNNPRFERSRKALPSGQGFELKDRPFTPDVIDAIFTAKSRPIESLPGVYADEVLQLPAGQGFSIADEVFPSVSNAKLRVGAERNPGLTGLRSYKGILRK